MLLTCININCKEQDFIDQILDGIKTVETRERNTLRSCVGKRVGVIRTGCGKAKLVGYVNIDDVIVYKNGNEFRRDEAKHLVKVGSKYDIKQDGIKYGYVLSHPERCEEMDVASNGIVIRKVVI